MRFLSSSALASAEKLRLAANCSAAETIQNLPLPPNLVPHAPGGSSVTAGRLYVGMSPRKSMATGYRVRGPAARSGSLLRRLLLGRQDLDRSAGLFDRGDR